LEWNDPLGKPIPLLVPYDIDGADFRLPSLRALESIDGLTTVFRVPVTQVGVFTPRIRYSAIKNPFDPESGWAAELGVQFGLEPWTLNSQNVLLVTSRFTTYLPLHSDVTLALNLRPWGGYTVIEQKGSSVLLRPELLQLGGDRTVRGYRNVSPFGLTDLDDRVATGETFGEMILLGTQANAELRWTVARNLGLGDLKLALFADAGFVTDEIDALPFLTRPPYVDFARSYAVLTSRRQLGFSVGVGARYVTPVGPASIDIAIAPLNDDTDGFRWLHLQFGYAF